VIQLVNNSGLKKGRLLFIRMVGVENIKRKEVIFNDYKPLGNGWIEHEVIFKNDNKIIMKEIYSKVIIPNYYNNKLFDSKNFKLKSW
jgi:hypothetical protein